MFVKIFTDAHLWKAVGRRRLRYLQLDFIVLERQFFFLNNRLRIFKISYKMMCYFSFLQIFYIFF